MTRSRMVANDERGIILGWIGKLMLGLAITAVVIYDAGSILINFFTLDSKAEEIAIVLTTNIDVTTLKAQEIQDEALALATEAEARLVEVEVDTTARVVRITLRRRADTLVVGRISFIKDWARATAEGEAGTG
ncbi:MAG: hypothetical protein M3277_10320 [Actinomycetota bacterium]|nr:hypothetical protein [Actinomycetota bacterium]